MKHFLYLCKRDKKGVVLLLTLNGSQISKTFLYDFEKLGLPENIKKNCENYYNSLRLTWQMMKLKKDFIKMVIKIFKLIIPLCF